MERHLDTVAPRCFLDDITGKNVMVSDDGQLCGLVDFDHVCFGDVLHWLGLTAAGILVDCSDRELWYAVELARAYGTSEAERRVAAFYAARIARGFLDGFSASQSQAWRARVSARIEIWQREATVDVTHGPEHDLFA
jgi:aminoglycoside phosphotransferase (APT) family kinase protein